MKLSDYEEIKYIMQSIVEEGEITGREEEVEQCLEAYRKIGEHIKQQFYGDLKGGNLQQDFTLCRGRLKIGVKYVR